MREFLKKLGLNDEKSDAILKEVRSRLIDLTNELSDLGLSFSEKLVHIAPDNETPRLVLDGVRFHKQAGNLHCVVYEQSPQIRTVFVDMSYHESYIGQYRQGRNMDNLPVEKFRIALPYMNFIFHIREENNNFLIEEGKVFMRNKPLTSFEDKVCLNFLPNTSDHDSDLGRVCHSWRVVGNDELSIGDYINKLVSSYWSTEFRYCLHYVLPEHPCFKTWKMYQEESLKDPLFILKCQFKELAPLKSCMVNNAYPTQKMHKVCSEFNKMLESKIKNFYSNELCEK